MASTNDHRGMELGDYLSVVRRRQRLMLMVTALVAASAVIFSLLQEEVYASKGRVLVGRGQSLFEAADARDDTDFVQTELQLVQSEGVRSLVRTKLGSAPKVSVTQVGTTAILEITTENTRPALAADATNAYMEAYLEFRARQATDALVTTSRQIQATVDALQAQIDDLSAQLRAVPCPGTGECPERAALEQDRDARLTEQVPFRQRLAQLSIDASATYVGSVVTPASVPTEPVRPTPVRNGVLGLGLGLVLSLGLALAFEYLDDSVRDPQDVERAVPGLAILATIPAAGRRTPKGQNRQVVALSQPSSPEAEAYRRLRTGIRSLAVDQPLRWVQVTSATASEGKTTTVANLGLVLSRAGERVIIVSWDLRRPRVHEHFGLSNDVGLTSVLQGEVALQDALQPVTEDGRLWLLAAGPIPPNPSDLLSSAKAREVLGQLKTEGSTVLFDCPPVLPVADAVILAEQVDAALVVGRERVSTRRKLARAVEVLRQAGAPLLGSVLHTSSPETAYEYGYPYVDGESAFGRAGDQIPGLSPRGALNGGGAHPGTEEVIRQSQNGPVDGSPPQLGDDGEARSAALPAQVKQQPAPSVEQSPPAAAKAPPERHAPLRSYPKQQAKRRKRKR